MHGRQSCGATKTLAWTVVINLLQNKSIAQTILIIKQKASWAYGTLSAHKYKL